MYYLPIDDPTAVTERVKELVDHDNYHFAATELDDVSGTKEASPGPEYLVADDLSLMKAKSIIGLASIFYMHSNYRHYLYPVF